MAAIDRVTQRIEAQQATASEQATSAIYQGVANGFAIVQTTSRDRVLIPSANINTNGALRIGQTVQLTRPLGGQPFVKAQVR